MRYLKLISICHGFILSLSSLHAYTLQSGKGQGHHRGGGVFINANLDLIPHVPF